MSNIHPTIEKALEPFFEIMGATEPPASVAPPANPALDFPYIQKGCIRGFWSAPGGRIPDLAVDYMTFSRQWGRRDEWGQPLEPDSPAAVEIQAVWLGRFDIYELLSEDVLSQLEAYFCPAQD